MYLKYLYTVVRENILAIFFIFAISIVFLERITYQYNFMECKVVSYLTESTMVGEKLMIEVESPSREIIFVNLNSKKVPKIGELVTIIQRKSYLSGRSFYTLQVVSRK